MRVPAVLEERNFRLLFIGQSVSVLGDGMVPVALAFAVLEVSDSPSALGIVLAARLIPTVVLLLAGVLVATAGAGVALAIDAATFAVSAVFLVALRLGRAEPAPARPFISELREGWSEFVARDWVWGIVLGAAIGNMLAAGYQVLGPVIAERELGGAGAWASIATCFGIGSFLGGAAILRWRAHRPLLVAVLAVSIWPVAWVLLSIPTGTGWIALAAFFGGGGLMIFNALWEATLQTEIPPASLSRVSAYDWLGSLALNPLGTALVGLVAAGVGMRATMLACAVLITVVNGAMLLIPGVRDTRAVAVSP